MINETHLQHLPLDIPPEQRLLDQVYLAPYYPFATEYLRHHQWFGAPVMSVAKPEMAYRDDGIETPDFRSTLQSAKGKTCLVYGVYMKKYPDSVQVAEPVPYVTVSYTNMDPYLVTTDVSVSFLLDYSLMRFCIAARGSCIVTPYGGAQVQSSILWHRADGISRAVESNMRINWSGFSEKSGIALVKEMFAWEHLDELSEARGHIAGSVEIKQRITHALSPELRLSREYPTQ